jgi:hypothetical protein
MRRRHALSFPVGAPRVVNCATDSPLSQKNRPMSQQDRVPSESSNSAEVRSYATMEARGDSSDMTEHLFSELRQLCPNPSVEPVPLRYLPVASRAWSFVNKYYPPSRLGPPDASPYCCDRCKPRATAEVCRVEATPSSRQSRERTGSLAPTNARADRVRPGTTPYYCDRCMPRATPAEAHRAGPTPMSREFCELPVRLEVRPDGTMLPYLRIGPERPFRYIPVAPEAWPFLLRYIKGAPRPKRWRWAGFPQ